MIKNAKQSDKYFNLETSACPSFMCLSGLIFQPCIQLTNIYIVFKMFCHLDTLKKNLLMILQTLEARHDLRLSIVIVHISLWVDIDVFNSLASHTDVFFLKKKEAPKFVPQSEWWISINKKVVQINPLFSHFVVEGIFVYNFNT